LDVASPHNTANIVLIAPGQVKVNKAGFYKVRFSVSVAQPSGFNVSVNAFVVGGSIYSNESGKEQNEGFVLLDLLPGDIIEIVSNNSGAPLVLSAAGTTSPQVIVGAMYVERLK
jgi:hypothetical protein